MFNRYFNLLIFLSVVLYASPKAFNSLGNELESFQKDCKTYQHMPSLPLKIKQRCKKFNSKLNKIFRIGYKIDPQIESDKINEKQLNKYLKLLRKADEDKNNILHLLSLEKRKARETDNINYYSQLIQNKSIKLYSLDYEFMEKHKDIFGENERYILHMNYLKSLKESAKYASIQKKSQSTPTKTKIANKPLPPFVQKIDYLTVTGNIEKGFLKINFFYYNRNSDELISWENDVAQVQCKAYENISKSLKPKLGKLLGSISKKTTHNWQAIYMKMRSIKKEYSVLKHGILECNVNLHGKILTDRSSFLMTEL